jgi:hypothetical protein
MSMDQYIQGLFNLAKDSSADVRKLVFTVHNYLAYQLICYNEIAHYGVLLICKRLRLKTI